MRNYELFLTDILESIEKIDTILSDCDYDRFIKDFIPQDVILRNLVNLGEAARNIPDSIRIGIPEIEWRKIVAFRNLLSHEYFGVDLDLVWNVCQTKLAPMEKAISKYLDGQ